jgi:hypothetical protein
MNDVWVRLYTGWVLGTSGDAMGWAIWQPGYQGHPWPHEELRPGFGYYVCESLEAGGRGIVARATVRNALGLTRAESPEDAHRLVADRLFDDEFSIGLDDWLDNPYNKLKADSPWPQKITAWRISTEPVGPHILSGLGQFPRTGWLNTDKIGLEVG